MWSTFQKAPVSEVYLLFYQAILQGFTHLNKLLQREEPIVGVISTQINEFLKKLLGKFVTVAAIRDALASGDILSIDYSEKNQLHG